MLPTSQLASVNSSHALLNIVLLVLLMIECSILLFH
jgi:hypothetical protein